MNISNQSQRAVEELVRLATASRTAEIVYRKPREKTPQPRRVEAYSFHESKAGDVSVKCWQVDSGWRCFRLDRFESATDGGMNFEPRRRVTLDTGELRPFWSGNASDFLTPVEAYRQRIEAALLDGLLTPEEIYECRQLAEDLPAPAVKAAHAEVFAAVLAEVTLDGLIDDDEAALLREVSEMLNVLGWSPAS